MYETIEQEIQLSAETDLVFDALTSSRSFSAFSGAPAEIDAVPGGAFKCFGGQIEGRNLEVNDRRQLIQAWRVKDWPAGMYSLVRFQLEPIDSGTRLRLLQEAPGEAAEHLKSGWSAMYFEPLKQFLEST
ncbi:MAG: SRPBCC domain-containing protein [Leptospiraceae bacterium]|nr:SRPBCC domain-containing protein [Leptospiraceae bacterium]